MHQQPDFDQSESKYQSRKEIIRTYRKITGHHSIPTGQQYWCLCGNQSKTNRSEIKQLIKSQLIEIEQFHGVDISEEKIKRNSASYPKAQWYPGEWTEILEEQLIKGSFNPALINLDTMNIASKNPATKITAATMELCPPGTVLAVNVMLSNPHNGTEFYLDEFIKSLRENLNSYQILLWNSFKQKVMTYSSTGQTLMGTYFFRKKYEI